MEGTALKVAGSPGRRKAVAAYWEPKLDSRLGSAFTLDDMVLTDDGVRVDYQNYEGKPVSVHFRFGPTGKIIHTTCGPRVRTERIDAAA